MSHIYSKEQGRLLSMPVWGKPKLEDYKDPYRPIGVPMTDHKQYNKDLVAYQEWLSNQPYGDAKDFVDGKAYVGNVDFKIMYKYEKKIIAGRAYHIDIPIAIPIKKEDETERGADDVPSVPAKDLASVASHSCTVGNSIEQEQHDFLWYLENDIIPNIELNEREKTELLDSILKPLLKPLLFYYYMCDLEKGVECMVRNDSDGKEYIFSFKTLEEWKKHTSLLNTEQNKQIHYEKA